MTTNTKPPGDASYNTDAGLDWERIEREWRANATTRELVRSEASAAAVRKGANPSEMRAAADAAWAKHLEKHPEEVTTP